MDLDVDVDLLPDMVLALDPDPDLDLDLDLDANDASIGKSGNFVAILTPEQTYRSGSLLVLSSLSCNSALALS